MSSIFNVMAAERYRLKTGFWPLFFIIATVGVVLASSLRLETNSYGSTVAALTWIKAFNAVLGVMICCALLRAPMTLTDSNFLRSKGDRLAYASAHVLMSLATAAVTYVLGVFATLVAFRVPGGMLALPFTAGSHEAIGCWFVENQPSGWLTVLARGELLDGGSMALLVASCAVLVVLLLAICARRRLK